jgi:hypothetical protein
MINGGTDPSILNLLSKLSIRPSSRKHDVPFIHSLLQSVFRNQEMEARDMSHYGPTMQLGHDTTMSFVNNAKRNSDGPHIYRVLCYVWATINCSSS